MARKPKLSKAEKIERDIRLNLRKQERAVEMQTKAAKMLRTSAQALARLHKSQRRLEGKTADQLVKTQVESPPKPLEDFVQRGQAAQAKVDQIIDEAAKAKPKRQRKPKNGGGPAQQIDEAVEAREQRMKAMGFRKTSKRKLEAPADKQ